MIIVNVITGTFLIVLGFLVRKYPGLIAGYNTMSAEQKKKVDVDGLSNMMRNGLLVMGVAITMNVPILTLIGLERFATGATIFIAIAGSIYLVVKAQKFQR